jgi:hypothetical protein
MQMSPTQRHCLIRAFSSSSLRVCFAFEMSTTVEKSSRKGHPEQEKLFLSLLSRPEYKLVGEDGDGVMERKLQAWWEPLLECFVTYNQAVLAKQPKTRGLGFQQELNVKGIQSKDKSMKDKCMSCKRQFKVDRHQVRGETGAAADGQLANAQAAIDAATENWPLFGLTPSWLSMMTK